MNVMLAENSGFCSGVRRIIKILKRLEKKNNVYTLGDIIHNPDFIQKLKRKGVKSVKSLDEIKEGTVIIRGHGVPPEEIDRARGLGLKVVNTTCPFVKKVQKIAKHLEENDYQVILFGDNSHPEVIGIRGYAKSSIVVSSLEESVKLGTYKKIGFISQTTQSEDLFDKISSELSKHTKDLKVYKTICSATRKRQESALDLAKKVDIIIVLGGKNSSNTKRLAEICEPFSETYHVEYIDELDLNLLKGKTVGLTAGASTPDYLINETLEKLKAIE